MKRFTAFLICFFILTALPVPVFYAFRDLIPSENTENKASAAFPTLQDGSYASWPKRFEAWFSDTLPFKTQLIRLYRGTQQLLGTDYEASDVIRGTGDWLHYRKTLENYKGLLRFSDNELVTMRDALTGFFAEMEAQGRQVLFYIAPDKEQVYPETMPAAILRVSELSAGDQVSAWLSSETAFPVFYPKAELQAAAGTMPIYFRTDTHWNELGGFLAAQQIREAFTGIPRTLPQWHYAPEPGKDLANMLGLSSRMTEENAVAIDFGDGLEVRKTGTIDHGTLQWYESDAGNGKLMVIGDSFSEYFLRSAIHDVGRIVFVTYGELSRIDMAAEDPDYIVLMLVERNLPFLLNGIW